jgi:hypothetical protein
VQAKEIANLRDRSSLSQQNWIKERDEMVQREAALLEQLESAKEAMQDWEVVAMEERSIRENLGERVSVLEEQLSTQSEAYEKVASERDSYSSTVDGLQRALQDIQDGTDGNSHFVTLLTLLKLAGKNCGKWWSTQRPNSMSCGNSSIPLKKLLPHLKRSSRRQRRSLSGHCRLKSW